MKTNYLIIFIFVITISGFVNLVFAQSVKTGMTFSDVAKLKGQPLNTDEHETSRKVIWTYKDLKVVFKDGKVIGPGSHKISTDKKQTKDSGLIKSKNKKELARKGTGELLGQTEVDEIIASIPNEADKPATTGSSDNAGASS
jgi:hypothetical protein